jgi:hypothetical protein
MSASDMWVHHSVGILKCSRTTHQEPVPPEGSEEEPEEMLKKIVALDPYEKRLKPINDDN